MSFPKIKRHERASCFNCEADLAVRKQLHDWARVKHRVQFVDRLALPDDDFTRP